MRHETKTRRHITIIYSEIHEKVYIEISLLSFSHIIFFQVYLILIFFLFEKSVIVNGSM